MGQRLHREERRVNGETRILSRVKTLTRREITEFHGDLIAVARAQVRGEIEDAVQRLDIVPPIWVGDWEDGDKVHVAAKVAVKR